MPMRMIWLWSWACYHVIVRWPGNLLKQPAYGMLPWAGVYAETRGGYAEFRGWWPIRHQLKAEAVSASKR